jgi:hypothetical protein
MSCDVSLELGLAGKLKLIDVVMLDKSLKLMVGLKLANFSRNIVGVLPRAK